MYEPPTGVIGSSGKEGEDGWSRSLGFRQWGTQVRRVKWAIFGLKTGQRRDVRGNVATLHRRIMPTSRCLGQRRDVPESVTKQRRDVGYQRRDVTETAKNQRRDVDISRRDVPEG